MANTFRYFNLKQMSPGQYNGLGISWDVKMVVDLRDLTDWGSIASAADSFPNKGSSLGKSEILNTSFSLGSVAVEVSAVGFEYVEEEVSLALLTFTCSFSFPSKLEVLLLCNLAS